MFDMLFLFGFYACSEKNSKSKFTNIVSVFLLALHNLLCPVHLLSYRYLERHGWLESRERGLHTIALIHSLFINTRPVANDE